MTTQDILTAEQEVTTQVTLYYEGMFWKAYERSAYLICTQIHAFKTSRRHVKQSREELISIGFPDTSLEKTMAGHPCVCQTHLSRTYGGFRPCSEAAFQLWKNGETPVPISAPDPVPASKSIPYYELPVYKTIRGLYTKMTSNKTLESIPKAVKKRIIEPAFDDMWDILVNIFEVRELEKQISECENEEITKRSHHAANTLLLEAKRKASRCIIAIRIVYETKVHAQDLGSLIPKKLYNDYSHDLVSVYRQLGFWARKHAQ